jgi:hypothetical protein
VVAGAIPILARNTHQIRPSRKGFDCLATNALVLSIEHYLRTGEVWRVPYGRKESESFAFFNADGTFKDSGYKNYMCFEFLPYYGQQIVYGALDLGDATIQQRWQERDGDLIMFGHIRTLVEVGVNSSVWCNGTTGGPTSIVICTDSVYDCDPLWREFKHTTLTTSQMIKKNFDNRKNNSFYCKRK